MVEEPEVVPSPSAAGEEEEEEEEGGGPVKTFLEHLEDLRWVLIKCVSAILIAMVVALAASDKLVAVLTWPLKRAMIQPPDTNRVVNLHFGTNLVGRLPRAELGGLPWDTNRIASLNLVLVPDGSNVALRVQPDLKRFEDPTPVGVVLKNYSPIGAFVVAIKLALYGGLVMAAPFVIFFVAQFVLPAMKVREKKWLYQSVGFGTALFLMGVLFCYFIIMQVALIATVSFSQWMGFGADEWRAEDYISFVCKFMLGMGASFQLPLILLTLVKIGLLDYPKLSKFRSYWIVINLVISAFITPSGDPFSMLVMAAPLQVLYEISVFIAWIWYRRDQRAQAAADAAPS